MESNAHTAPIVIVGSGPVGMRMVNELYQRCPSLSIKLFGNEPWCPYDRVKLSCMLAGEIAYEELFSQLTLPDEANFSQFENCPITAIDPISQYAVDVHGVKHPYSYLVMATGSTPYKPNIKGIELPGCYSFRDMTDALQLMARRDTSHKTIILGGGLLGIEAARAMSSENTEVTIIECGSHLMMNQLDNQGAAYLTQQLETMGLKVSVNSSVVEILGESEVTGIKLESGEIVPCDTVVIAAGIQPNVALAHQAGLKVRRGIDVNDSMCTNYPEILAVGECAEHRGEVYGLVAPGYEQAAVAAHTILGGDSKYNGSIAATRLKVVGRSVFSMGAVTASALCDNAKSLVFEKPEEGVYRKLVLQKGRLIGAIGLGEWSEQGRIQHGVAHERHVRAWQLKRFTKTGLLWPEIESQSVAEWPPHAVVCNCTGVNRGQLTQAMTKQGCDSVQALSNSTGAGTVCGSCRPIIGELVGDAERVREKAATPLSISGVLAIVISLMIVLLGPIPVAESINQSSIEQLWQDGFWKQVTGYTILGLTTLVGLMSLRKRFLKIPALGGYPWWRLMHGVTALLALGMLVLHTGMQLGENHNAWLMANYLLIVVFGAVAGLIAANEYLIGGHRGRKVRATFYWFHILLFWPLPALLAFHIFSAYYF